MSKGALKTFRLAGESPLPGKQVRLRRRALRDEAGGTRDRAPETEDEQIFALDIGTRSVIGLVGRIKADRLEIEAVASEEHQNRAVVDGQIEDIRETARIAQKVKQRLEEKLGRTLTQVYIAAAGRVLKTGEAIHEAEIPAGQEIDAALVAKLEFAAIQQVYESLRAQDEEQGESFLCVGHSVVYYRLDGYEFSTLIGHRGEKASVRIIATFLPKEVVDSLNTTMSRIGLTVAGITLEPIAAINAVIPADLRKLNLALVDIGAGTADIAICDKGSVSAYTMATVAGDEITEAIMEACLSDFHTAEELKRKLGDRERITYTNILDYRVETSGESLYQQVKPAVDHLVYVICERIGDINKKAPAAVFLVGGGSRLPNLCAMVAGELGMEESRVAVGGSANMRKQADSAEDIYGPEFATPLGIAITAAQRERDEAFTFSVNQEKVPMLGVWEMTVLDALQLAGYRYGQIMGRAGRTLIYELDGERRSRRGGLPGSSVVYINGNPCSIGDKVAPGDQLLFQPAATGKDAALTLEEAAGDLYPLSLRVNGVNYAAGRMALINGRPAPSGQNIRSMDVISRKSILTLEDLYGDLELERELYEIFINDALPSAGYALKDGDEVETRLRGESRGLPADMSHDPGSAGGIEAAVPGRTLLVYLNGEALDLKPKEDGAPHCFVDMFTYVNIDMKIPHGDLIQTVNGREAAYMLELADGDEIMIRWSEDRF